VQIYLPVAGLPVDALLMLALGFGVGVVSGLFGVGGGFLLTPLLIFFGITPPVAVATVSAQIAASSFSGALHYWRKGRIDTHLATILLIGSLAGSGLGVWLYALLRRAGQLDLFIALSYVTLLSVIGIGMVIESLRRLIRPVTPQAESGRGRLRLLRSFPIVLRFRRSRLAASLIVVLLVGLVVGCLGAVMGIGGGFLLVPAMIYLFGLSSSLTAGTANAQTVIVMLVTLVLHAVFNQTVDAVLALLLMAGGSVGAQWGARMGLVFRSEVLRFALGCLIIAVATHFVLALVVPPPEPFALAEARAP